MLRVVATVAAIAAGATLVYADVAAIGQRQAILKTFGGAMTYLGEGPIGFRAKPAA